MEKRDKNLSIKLIALMLLSNISVYLLFSCNEEHSANQINNQFEFRKDYIELKIDADLKTPFKAFEPVMISNKRKSLIVQYAVLLEKEENNSLDEFDEPQNASKTYTIYVHKEHAQSLINQKDLMILPLISGFETKKISKRRNYDISI